MYAIIDLISTLEYKNALSTVICIRTAGVYLFWQRGLSSVATLSIEYSNCSMQKEPDHDDEQTLFLSCPACWCYRIFDLDPRHGGGARASYGTQRRPCARIVC
jgi:hypothetical protein